VQFLAERLNQYEALLQEHGIATDKLHGHLTSELPSRPTGANTLDSNAPSSLEAVATPQNNDNNNTRELQGPGRFGYVEK
jgi:hypothetical protein